MKLEWYSYQTIHPRTLWQITILRERDLTSESYQTVAVALKRRRAGEREAYSHVPGELLLVFVDEDGQEILAL